MQRHSVASERKFRAALQAVLGDDTENVLVRLRDSVPFFDELETAESLRIATRQRQSAQVKSLHKKFERFWAALGRSDPGVQARIFSTTDLGVQLERFRASLRENRGLMGDLPRGRPPNLLRSIIVTEIADALEGASIPLKKTATGPFAQTVKIVLQFVGAPYIGSPLDLVCAELDRRQREAGSRNTQANHGHLFQ
jgi:hypothetical protein